MTVTVKLFAHFRDRRFAVEDREYPGTTTVGDVIDGLGIDRDEVGITMINAVHRGFDAVLADGDVLTVFPLVGGG